jgi:mRNA interferase RelE/StbE
MPYEIILQPSAEKSLDRVPRKDRMRIVEALEDLRNESQPKGCKKLKGEENLWRIRVGKYRVVYAIREKELVLLVVRVAHRKDAYRDL